VAVDLDFEVRTIRNAPIFKGLDPCKMRLLACISEQVAFEPGEVVCEAGEVADAAYVILEGEVEFVVPGPKGERVLGRQGPGSMFGEVGLLCDSDRLATVRAVTPLSLMRINRDCFLRMMQDNPQFSMAVATELARRVVSFAERAGAEITH
jgi:CRP-like cAMP-binding protein